MIQTLCEHCGSPFLTWPYKLRQGRGKYCSKPCHGAAMTGMERLKPRSLEERFWEKVKREGPGDCWLWSGSRTLGYGTIGHNGRVRRATHVSWELRNGQPWPSGKIACHTCDNPPCVNPAHLFVGTKQTNADDMAAKGRSTKGTRRTHCRNGHLRTPKNTYHFVRDGSVYCRDCRRERDGSQPRRQQENNDVVI